MTRRIIRTDGTVEELPHPISTVEIMKVIGASCLDTVNLLHLGYPLWVMALDDNGLSAGKTVNARATELYHANCRPGTTSSFQTMTFNDGS